MSRRAVSSCVVPFAAAGHDRTAGSRAGARKADKSGSGTHAPEPALVETEPTGAAQRTQGQNLRSPIMPAMLVVRSLIVGAKVDEAI